MTNGEDPIDRALLHIEVAPRLGRMPALFGVAGSMPQMERWRSDEMVARCADCQHKAECAALLCCLEARAEQAGFCPNSDHLRALAATPG